MKLARVEARLSQKQLGEACGLSQSAISRLEGHGTATYNMTLLARAAIHLSIPLRLVGLADQSAALAAHVDGSEVERRTFFKDVAAVAAVPLLSPTFATRSAQDGDVGQAAPLRLATTAFRRLDGSTSSRQLQEPVLAHLRLAQAITSETDEREAKMRLAAVGSEAASLAGWLAWDMGDYGSARTWYGTAVKAARSSGDQLLAAYQIGSLAQFEAHAGNAVQGLNLLQQARRQLADRRLAIADAWLLSAEALAHAAAGDQRSSDRALTKAARTAESVSSEEPAPWPWMFTFNGAKVAAMRLSCGARLGLPEWVRSAQDEAGEALTSGHEKQRALLTLDLASAHLASGRLDGAFFMATRALETGVRYRSGRIVERARAVRRSYTSPTPPKVVRDFDERLHGVYL
ncbi:helix-turn-helix domain-containing protein [Streptomyces sp. NBC_00448]|uniref:helix-turn-helix domain-containing protein n=1 Tax=Streptomyces sp. NBC_00448 TaxID=2903652 RepID=UPI002E1A1FF8